MGFWTTIFGLARKKFVGPPIAVAAIILALAGYFLMPSRYVSTASMVLTVPATGGTLETEPREKPGLTNPLLQFNDALRTTAGILILATNTPEVHAEIGVTEDGPTSVTINDGRTNPDLLGISTNGPFVYVEVESTSPQAVRDVMRKAQQRVRLELADRQVALDAPVSTHIGILDVMPASRPRAVLTDRVMMTAGGALLGVVAGLTIAYAIPRLRPVRRDPPAGRENTQPAMTTAESNGTTPEPPAHAPSPPHPAEAPARAASGPYPAEAPARVGSGPRPAEDVQGTVEFRVRNGVHGAGAPVFPMTVAELDDAEGRAEDDTGPIEVVVPRDDQLDSTT